MIGLWLLAASPALMTDAADLVDPARLENTVIVLQSQGRGANAAGTRVTGTPGIEAARAWLMERLSDMGHVVKTQPFHVRQVFADHTVPSKNVIVSLGPDTGGRWVVVAHFDSRAAQNRKHAAEEGWVWNRSPAPGADDNGSGSAALLELARILSDPRFAPKVGLDLVWSGAEEMAKTDPDQFMVNLGAEILADRYLENETEIWGALSVDMLLRPRSWGPSFRLYHDGRWGSAYLVEAVLRAAQTVGPQAELTIRLAPDFTWSDHGAFWARGWGGVLLIEDDFHHVRYHRPNDLYHPADGFYDLTHLTLGTRILVGAAIWLGAGPLD